MTEPGAKRPLKKSRRNKQGEIDRLPPASDKAVETYNRLVESAGILLGEVGFERLSSNAICERAELTPPTFYRYFNNKYEILEVLAERLLTRSMDALAIWLARDEIWDAEADNTAVLEQWFRISSDIVASEPGGIWTMRAMRALPQLSHLRLQSQRQMTKQMFAIVRKLRPELNEDLLFKRLRLVAEFGYAVDELLLEEDRISSRALIKQAAFLFNAFFAAILRDPD